MCNFIYNLNLIGYMNGEIIIRNTTPFLNDKMINEKEDNIIEPKLNLENFFDQVKYENFSDDSFYFTILIKDCIITSLNNSKTKIIKTEEGIFLYLTFSNDKSFFVEINLDFDMALYNYTFEIQGENLKINFTDKKEDKLRILEIEFIKTILKIYCKTFLNRISRTSYRKLVKRNVLFLKRNKVKTKIFEILKQFYFNKLRKKITNLKITKFIKKSSFNSFRHSCNDVLNTKRQNLNYKLLNTKLLYFRILKQLIFHNKQINTDFNLRVKENNNKFSKIISEYYRKKFINKLRIYNHLQKLNTGKENVSECLSAYFRKMRLFKLLKKNLHDYKQSTVNMNNLRASNLIRTSFKILYQYTLKRRSIYNNILNFNKSNLKFLSLISSYMKRTKINLNKAISTPYESEIRSKISEVNKKLAPFQQKCNKLFYHNPIKKIFFLIKNYYLKKLIIYNKLAKLSLIFSITNKLNKRKYYHNLAKKIALAKRINFLNFSKIFIAALYKNKVNSSQTSKLKNVKKIMNLANNYNQFISNCCERIKLKTTLKVNSQIIKKKFAKFKFYQFIYNLNLKGDKFYSMDNIKSNSTILKENELKVKEYIKDISRYFYFRKLLCHTFDQIKNKVKLSKLKEQSQKITKRFFCSIKRIIKIKLLKKFQFESKSSLFFQQIHKIINYKNTLKCADYTRRDKLNITSLFILKNYLAFKKQKRNADNYFTINLNKLISNYLFTKYFKQHLNILSFLSQFKTKKILQVRLEFVKKLKLMHLSKLINKKYKLFAIKNTLKKAKESIQLKNKFKLREEQLKLRNIKDFFIFTNGKILKKKNSYNSKIKTFQKKNNFKFILKEIRKRKIFKNNLLKFQIKQYFNLIELKRREKQILETKKKKFKIKLLVIKIKKVLLTILKSKQINSNFVNRSYKRIFKKFVFNYKLKKMIYLFSPIILKYKKYNFNRFVNKIDHLSKLKKFFVKSSRIHMKKFITELKSNLIIKNDFIKSLRIYKSKHFLGSFMKKVLSSMIQSTLDHKVSYLVLKNSMLQFKQNCISQKKNKLIINKFTSYYSKKYLKRITTNFRHSNKLVKIKNKFMCLLKNKLQLTFSLIKRLVENRKIKLKKIAFVKQIDNNIRKKYLRKIKYLNQTNFKLDITKRLETYVRKTNTTLFMKNLKINKRKHKLKLMTNKFINKAFKRNLIRIKNNLHYLKSKRELQKDLETNVRRNYNAHISKLSVRLLYYVFCIRKKYKTIMNKKLFTQIINNFKRHKMKKENEILSFRLYRKSVSIWFYYLKRILSDKNALQKNTTNKIKKFKLRIFLQHTKRRFEIFHARKLIHSRRGKNEIFQLLKRNYLFSIELKKYLKEAE